MKVAVVFWSGTGNTEEMAKLVAQGVESNGNTAELVSCDKFNKSLVGNFDAFAFGCPSMGAEELEDGEFLPMWEDVKSELNGKNVVLFGSYGWGDGEWMETWKSECGSMNLLGDFICCGAASGDDETSCVELGKLLK
ncbi:MAG: flavodoxin domain-containing protein [bacterium]